MTQQLWAFVALTEDPGSIFSTHMGVHKHKTLVPTLFSGQQAPPRWWFSCLSLPQCWSHRQSHTQFRSVWIFEFKSSCFHVKYSFPPEPPLQPRGHYLGEAAAKGIPESRKLLFPSLHFSGSMGPILFFVLLKNSEALRITGKRR